MSRESQSFVARLRSSQGRLFFSLPFEPARFWGPRGRYYLNGTVAGVAWRGLPEPEAGEWRVWLGPAWVRDNPVAEGNEVAVTVAIEGPQTDDAPDLEAAFAAQPEAAAFYRDLPSFYRNNWQRWIDSAKRPETRARRIAEMIECLREGKRER